MCKIWCLCYPISSWTVNKCLKRFLNSSICERIVKSRKCKIQNLASSTSSTYWWSDIQICIVSICTWNRTPDWSKCVLWTDYTSIDLNLGKWKSYSDSWSTKYTYWQCDLHWVIRLTIQNISRSLHTEVGYGIWCDNLEIGWNIISLRNIVKPIIELQCNVHRYVSTLIWIHKSIKSDKVFRVWSAIAKA